MTKQTKQSKHANDLMTRVVHGLPAQWNTYPTSTTRILVGAIVGVFADELWSLRLTVGVLVVANAVTLGIAIAGWFR